MHALTISTKNKKQILDITDKISAAIKKTGAREGACMIFIKHTTAALTTADLDPGGTDLDYLESLTKMIPEPDAGFRHPHNPAHMPDHILSSLIGTSLTLPIQDGKLALGTWQRVAIIEFDGPRDREIILQILQTSEPQN